MRATARGLLSSLSEYQLAALSSACTEECHARSLERMAAAHADDPLARRLIGDRVAQVRGSIAGSLATIPEDA